MNSQKMAVKMFQNIKSHSQRWRKMRDKTSNEYLTFICNLQCNVMILIINPKEHFSFLIVEINLPKVPVRKIAFIIVMISQSKYCDWK